MIAFAKSERNAGDEPMVLARAALAAVATAYCAARFGIVPGAHVFAAAVLFVGIDYLRIDVLRRLPFGLSLECTAVFAQGAVLGILFVAPSPFGLASLVPSQFVLLQTPILVLLLCFVVSSASARAPALVWCAGIATCAIWLVGWRVEIADPATITQATIHMERYKSALALLRAVDNPYYFNLNLMKGAVFTAALITVVMGLGLYRVRRLARTTAEHEALRNTLAAHFSPAIVATILASADRQLGPQTRRIAVLDCDLVGFTAVAESLSPESVARVLGRFRSTVEKAVFEEEGAILFFVGDGAVAGFGLTEDSRQAAACALAAARCIAHDWDAEEAGEGKRLPVAIGLEFGTVNMGLVGEARAMSLLVLGEPIEKASALQAATREASTPILIGEALREELEKTDPKAAENLVRSPVAGIEAWRLNAP